ncbi:MAG: NAD(P) transhydrogenase subunit alpha part 1 [Alphaproteobacteria bacterium MarineAlpha3_Bin4]|nr:MAG: NAD(P) transhydrogenase subunit alpha part 1 [Alphaproteobacteria bacterium MarineAlpha3_Bin4]
MKIAVPKECRRGEARVAVSPEVVKKLIKFGFTVAVEKGAGIGTSFTDAAYKEAGAQIAPGAAATYRGADMVFKVAAPESGELATLKKGTILVAHLNALADIKGMQALAKTGVTAFAMEMMPRISRAQSMDILSSQSNLAGYKAVLDAASEFGRVLPMMMTAAGTVPPARVFIMGVGVAGLQAIATAKRLGAIVTATDVRLSTKEQVESLGGKFLEVDPEMEKDAQTESGYAREMPPEYFEKQKQVVAEHLKKQDIVITTALIPGRPAPILLTEGMVATMPAGSVIVDLAVEAGGNCSLTKLNQVTTTKNGVKIIGHGNVASRMAEDASVLYAKNLLNFITPHVDPDSKSFAFDWEDETISGTLVTKDGRVVHPRLVELVQPAKKHKSKIPAAKKANG